MSPEEKQALARALAPVVTRVRTDVTAVKANGKQAWTNEPLTQERLERHVNGAGPARGCCPIKAGESVTMLGLFDLDSHKGEISWPAMADWADRISASAEMFGLNAIPFRSSGGNGIHLIFIWDEPQDAYSVRQLLKGVLASVGLADGAKGLVDGEVEVFPKQDSVPADGRGNQFIMPLAGKSEPLIPMLDYEPAGKDYAIGMQWPVSEPVARMERPEKPVRAVGGAVRTELATLRGALDAIPNEDAAELGYDAWRDVVFGIHYETSGDDEGLALAHEFSMRSSKYDPEFLESRVWPYIKDRDDGVTGRTILAMAREHGWQEDISHMFEPLPVVIDAETGNVAAEDEELPAFQRSKNGEILATLENVIKGAKCYAMVGCRLGYDEFKDAIMVTTVSDGSDGWRPFTDVDYVKLRLSLEQRDFKPIGREMIRDVVLAVAKERAFDSAILWARQLTWDGVPRIERFLVDRFGAEDGVYARAVSLYMWSALAGRLMVPGTKADMSPVLIGDQGIRKSTGIAAMAPYPESFVELDLGDKDDDNARKLRGVLVAETGEMKGMYNREQEHIKSFMSRTFELWVPKWQEYSTRYYRRCLFIGSSNQSEFLIDETGNRRWLPLYVTKVDTAAIEADREQLWAEAIEVFKSQGVVWQQAEVLARDVHSAHMIHDEWEAIIDSWLHESDDDGVRGARALRLAEVISGALGVFVANIDRKTELRVGKVMRKLGYEKRDTRTGKTIHKLWHRKVSHCHPSVSQNFEVMGDA